MYRGSKPSNRLPILLRRQDWRELVYWYVGLAWAVFCLVLLIGFTQQPTAHSVVLPIRGQTHLEPVVKREVGVASWLRYELPDSCAARDWPKGTILKVESTVGVVWCVRRDTGPDPLLHPDRIVDLNLEQFAILAPPSEGLVQVTVTPL